MNSEVQRHWLFTFSALVVLFFRTIFEYFTMTVTQDENEPLIGKRNTSYSAVSYDRKVSISDNNADNEFCLDNLNHKVTVNTNGNTKTSELNGTHNGSGNGDHQPPQNGPNGITINTDRISYTWHDMNVFTTGIDSRRSGWWWARREMGTGLRKHILKNVCGAAYPGELLAIMGSSGAGKTTLLNTLMFRSASSVAVTGQRSLNGVPVSSSALTSLSAYVQQDDLFIGTLTVKEHLIFHALVRMDRGIPYKQRMLRVDEVISELALTKCQDTVIGIPGRIKGVSGGEMKRLSFASEVLTDPPLMFCDEPTSGLDSFMAQNVVSVMKSMALKGKTVVSTIHQPSSEVFAMFDKVLLMAEGRVAFLGTADAACDFFNDLGAPCPSNYNPADYFIQLLAVVPAREESCRETIEMVCDAFDRSDAGIKLAAETEILPEIQAKMALNGGGLWGDEFFQMGGGDHTRRSPYKASWWAQFRAVLWRSWLSVIKEPILIKVRLLQTIMVAVIIGIIYFGQKNNQEGVMNINGALFIFLTNMTFQNVFAVISVFCSELPVFMREHFNGTYRVDVYFLCKTIAEVPIFMIIPILFTAVTYYLVGLNPEINRFFIAGFIIMLVANVATSFGYLISCVSSSVSMALSIGPPVIIPFLLFGGFLLNTGSVPVYFKWLSYLSWFKYGNEALLINQWDGVENIDCTNANTTCPKNGHVILETLNFSETHFAMDIWCLVALIIGFRVFAFLALLAKTFRKD